MVLTTLAPKICVIRAICVTTTFAAGEPFCVFRDFCVTNFYSPQANPGANISNGITLRTRQ